MQETQYMRGLYAGMSNTDTAEVYAVIGGQQAKATEVYVNVNGTLKQLPHKYGYQLSTVPERKVFEVYSQA